MKLMLRTTLAAALTALLLAAGPATHAASSVFTAKANANWNNITNWLSETLPLEGDDLVIADVTTNQSLTMNDGPHTIGVLQFGATGTRANPGSPQFIINGNVTTAAAYPLTITNGVVANGNFQTSGTAGFQTKLPITVQGDQTWSIGGNPGSSTADFGLMLTVGANTVLRPLVLNGVLTKTGPGQLGFVGQNVGNGDIVVNQGSLKFNAGSSSILTVGGTGSITVNNGASLYISKNSGTLNITKAIVLNDGATLRLGGGNAVANFVGSPFTFNGTVPILLEYAGLLLNFTNNWSGTLNTTITGSGGTNNFWGNNSSLAGTLNNNGTYRMRFGANNSGSAGVAWGLNNAAAYFDIFGPATSLQLGALSGNAGTVRNSNTNAAPASVTVGALHTSTTFGGLLADDTAALGLVKTGSGTLTLTGANTYTGGTTVDQGTLLLQGAAASTGGGTVTVASGATFGGTGTAIGSVNILAGGTLATLGGSGLPSLSVGPLTLGSAATDTTATTVNVYRGGKITATSGLTVNGTNIINIVGAAPAVGTYDLIQHPGSIGGAGFSGFKLGALPNGAVAHLQNSGAAVQLVVTAITTEPSVWAGGATGTWNLTGTLDWKGANTSTPQSYRDQDVTIFDDSAANFTVTLVTNVTPAVVTVAAATHTYLFDGTGSIGGLTTLTKDGAGTLILANPNTYSDGTFITNGTVQLGNGGTSGSIVGPVQNGGTLAFNRTDAFTVPGVISGAGSVEQKGLGVTTLGAANTFEGATTITTGTLAAGNGAAFGNTNLGVTISTGATLDVNSQALAMEPIAAVGAGVGGAGAIVNNGPADSQSATRFVTLTGDTTFGALRRWDIRNPSSATDTSGGTHAYLHGNGHNLTKVGSNVVAFINVGDTALGNIDIQAGTLTFSRSTMAGNAASRLTAWPGATLQFHRLNEYVPNPFNKVISLTNATLAVEASGLTNDISGPITLTGSNVVTAPAATGLILRGALSGSGSLNHRGPNLLVISGNANHTGGTTVSGSLLQVDGTLGAGAAISSLANSTLSGTGSISGVVTIPAGSRLSPGNGDVATGGIGTLGVGSLVLQTGSTNRFKLNTDFPINDRVNAASSVFYGGTLIVTNLGFAYAPGNAFKLFNATTYSGIFATIVPATPALGLLWDTNTLATDGTLRVIVQPTPRPLVVLSVSSLLSNSLNVVFDAEVDLSTATDPNNYTISTGQHISSIPYPASATNNLQLILDAPLTSPTYSVQVKNVKDVAYVPNTVVTTNVPGIAWGFRDSIGVIITDGYAYAFANQIKIYGSGTDIFGTVDQFQFVYNEVTGDFDYSVMLQSFLTTQEAAKAGIMVREINDPTSPLGGDRNAMVASFPPVPPGRNQNLFQFRDATDATSVAVAAPRPPATYPTNWLRLKRSGSVVSSFCGNNGLDWTFIAAVDSATNIAGAYPATVRLGLAVSSHTVGVLTEAVMSNYGLAKERPALTVTKSGTDVILTWPTSGLGWTLQASPSLTAPDANWQPIAGSASVTTKTLPIGAGNRFFRLVQ
jgi:autotransporter-associated beta strand protein